MTETERTPMQMSCGSCKHYFDGPFLPMSVSKFCEYMKGIRCPKCASSKTYVHERRMG